MRVIIGRGGSHAAECKDDIQQCQPVVILPMAGHVGLTKRLLVDQGRKGLEMQEIGIEHLHFGRRDEVIPLQRPFAMIPL